jgi:hypothetical protein
MLANIQEILEIIDESFLRNEEKQLLKNRLEKEGVSDAFFAYMNKLLVSELKKRSSLYEKVIDGFNSRLNSIEVEYKSKRQELDANLNKSLSEIDPVDISGKEKIFDQYYKNIDSAQTIYEKKVKDLYSQLLLSIMKEIS